MRTTPSVGGVASLEAEADALEADAESALADAELADAEALEADADALDAEDEALDALPEPPEQATMNSASMAANTMPTNALYVTDCFIVPFPLSCPKR